MKLFKNKKENQKIDDKKGKTLKGEVVSNKMEKTLVVLVKRFVKHPKYGKYRTITKRYKAHYDEGEYEIGDKVEIKECNPISKDKKFKIVKS
ncbi:MAG: 30S ribosomal protein S17 [Candidatus Pacebacteria bacterium]|nr:30S ribosomal protein S17 [Candidatus Paceibacterota bacterium]